MSTGFVVVALNSYWDLLMEISVEDTGCKGESKVPTL